VNHYNRNSQKLESDRPPASAKSLFMHSLIRLERSYYAIGSSSTKSGIFDYLFEQRPHYFIVDETRENEQKDQTSLLNLMESGILSELKYKQRRITQLKTWVFASCSICKAHYFILYSLFSIYLSISFDFLV
jgi:holliday junction DNA helicase RuvB